jgi:hypothetical protein
MSHEERPLRPQGTKVEGTAMLSTHLKPHFVLEGSRVLQVVAKAVESVPNIRDLDGFAPAAALK